jgi:sodium-dependent dicarboxylate transporter 2/3/5
MALITIYLPILAGAAKGAEVNPLLLMIPATIAASCAFMLPMSTPPNAIVFASGYVRITQMIKAGFVICIASILLVVLMTYYLSPLLFGFDINVFPAWANIKG